MAKSKSKKKSSASAGESFKSVAIGDLHFDKLSHLFPSYNRKVAKLLDSILEAAVSEDCDLAILLGDTSHKNTLSSEALGLFTKVIVKYQDKIQIHMIEGNHGYKRNGDTPLVPLKVMQENGLIKAKVYTEPGCIVHKGVTIMMLPFPYTSVSQALSSSPIFNRDVWSLLGVNEQEYDEADGLGADLDSISQCIAIGHFTRSGSTNDNNSKAHGGIKSTDDHWYVLGHVHTPQVVGQTFYPGSPHQTSFGEGKKKGYGIFTAQPLEDNTVDFKWDWREHKTPYTLATIYVDDADQLPTHTKSSPTMYRVMIPKGFELTPEILASHSKYCVFEQSKVVKSNKKDDESIVESPDADIEKILTEFLNDQGLSDKQIAYGIRQYQEAMSS